MPDQSSPSCLGKVSNHPPSYSQKAGLATEREQHGTPVDQDEGQRSPNSDSEEYLKEGATNMIFYLAINFHREMIICSVNIQKEMLA